MNEKPSRSPLIAAGTLATILDLLSKWWVFRTLEEGYDRPVIGNLLMFRPVHNTAGPWSWGQGWNFLRYVLPAVSIAAVVVIGRIFLATDPRDRVKGLGLALILGGAMGNLYDRVLAVFGSPTAGVRDFILVKGVWFGGPDGRFPHGDFPAFNLADTWITVGVVLVAWRILFEMRSLPAGGGAGPAEPGGVRA